MTRDRVRVLVVSALKPEPIDASEELIRASTSSIAPISWGVRVFR